MIQQQTNINGDAEERFAIIFHSAPVPIVLTRVTDGIAVDVNPAFCALFGYTRDEVIGRTSAELGVMDPELREQYMQHMRDWGRIYNLETQVKNRTGQALTVLLSVQLIHSSGDAYMLSTLVDVTEARKMTSRVKKQNEEMEQLYTSIVDTLASLIDIWDASTAGHSRRVAQLTVELAKRFGFSAESLKLVFVGALLHDIGKVGIPERILRKADKLTDEEMTIMKRHPEYARSILSVLRYLGPALDIPYAHHERYDGTGYPRQLVDGHIPICARIFAVVDVWDALTHDRVYRRAWDKRRALEYIRSQAGVQFDPEIVVVFEQLIEETEFAI